MEKFARLRFQPVVLLGENGTRITECQAHKNLSRKAAAEGMVLLKNQNNALPLKNEKVALFGKNFLDLVYCGGGSGMVHVTYAKNLLDGLEEKETEGKLSIYRPTVLYYKEFLKNETSQNEGTDKVEYHREKDVPEHLIEKASKEADTAIVTISRYSFEGGDRKAEKGDYYLSDIETELIDKVSQSFKKTIILLNVGAVMDCEYIAKNKNIDAILCTWQPGLEGGAAIADVLCGDVTPSGKLCDTIAKKYEDYPSSLTFNESEEYVNYSEDIYVGYRYFETIPNAKDKVRYPFGFGLSYTDFSIKPIKAYEENGIINAEVLVENIGEMAGKEVIELYYSAPQGILGKPAKELCAFKKTKLLAPKESQNIKLSFDISVMASFDDLGKIEKSAFILEKGDYEFFLGNSVRNAEKIDFVYSLSENVLVEKLSSSCEPFQLPKRMLADGSYEKLEIKEPHYSYGKNESITGTKPEEETNFYKVAEGKNSLEDFMAQLTDEELAHMVGCGGLYGVSNTQTFGGNDRLLVPKVTTADGPAGLRIEEKVGVHTTAWPVATALACTWNEELVYKVGECGAKEVKENNIAVWLTPALNIHRNPLCGRNFEYYSEDPFVSGVMAATMTKGIQSQNIGVSIKHFACNNKEVNRFNSDSRVSERALREIYLKGFEICVKEAKPYTLMSSYNKLNGIHTSESYDLLTTILRKEWGFDGMITTDWGIKNNPVNEVKAGNDMKMHIGYPEDLIAALNSGELTRADLEACVYRILTTYLKFD